MGWEGEGRGVLELATLFGSSIVVFVQQTSVLALAEPALGDLLCLTGAAVWLRIALLAT